jgi:adenylate cyclase
LRGELDYDRQFAQALQRYPVVLGYYFTSDREGEKHGQLPAPVLNRQDLQGRNIRISTWDGYGANLPLFAQSAHSAGFFNALNSGDGVVRTMPLLAQYDGQYYQSLPLAMLRLASGQPKVVAGFPPERFLGRNYQHLSQIELRYPNGRSATIPVDDQVATSIPFRGAGGARGGSFAYFSASDILQKRTPAASLQNKLVLLGTTAPGLLDLRTTPVGDAYPGVEVHANVLAGFLEGIIPVRPDYALGYEIAQLLLLGGLLLLSLPLLNAMRSIALGIVLSAAVLALNTWLYLAAHLALPIASALLLIGAMLLLHLAYSYFIANRSKRDLAKLFGSYVPSELVDQMLQDPKHYSMQARNQDLSVMFCDLRGFTKMAEGADPLQVQAMLNQVFGHLTQIISQYGGTIDKYMGDCVMAFWGAPLDLPDHATQALRCSQDILASLPTINTDLQAAHLIAPGHPPLAVSIALNAGQMCVGNMGTTLRQAYTVIGDEVNLAARIEPLSRLYAVDIITTLALKERNADWVWQELDLVQVKGRQAPERIFTPIALRQELSESKRQELKIWLQFLKAYRSGQIEQAEMLLFNLTRQQPKSTLYALYAERLHLLRREPQSDDWQGIAVMGPSKYSPLV